MLGAFTVGRPEEVKGRPPVVDDVYTTGTKVAECARVLDRAQHLKCGCATGARTLQISAREVEIVRGEEGDEEVVPLAQAARG
jgi:orotate phosphoribosyltransferase